MAVEILERFTCDCCGQVELRTLAPQIYPGYRVAFETPPLGWIWVGHELICPRHQVMVTDKGREGK